MSLCFPRVRIIGGSGPAFILFDPSRRPLKFKMAFEHYLAMSPESLVPSRSVIEATQQV